MSRSALMQNIPGDRQSPVGASPAVWARLFQQAPRWGARSMLVHVLVVGVCVVVGLVVAALADSTIPGDTMAWIVGFSLVVVGLAGWAGVRTLLRPRREQRRYHRLRGTIPLTAEQQEWLRPIAWAAFRSAQWAETLEPEPRSVGLTARQQRSFIVLNLRDPAYWQEQLSREWNIVDGREAVALVEELSVRGYHSFPFAGVMRAEGGEQSAGHLAALLDVPRERVLAAVNPAGRRPPRLVWAFDLWRAAHVTRTAYAAGYLDEATTWQYLRRISRVIFALFDSEEEYVFNVRLGHAFWCNDLAAVRERARLVEGYLASRWPARTRPWPRNEGYVPISEAMATGFAVEPE